jgi:SAM-dependent methyltransferase
VWEEFGRAFRQGGHILELNCGTGEDAIFLSRMGMRVLACDASENMIAVALRRKASEAPESAVQFKHVATEDLSSLKHSELFDGVLSNFGGLNCVADLPGLARALSTLVKPGGSVLLSLCARFCLWEMVWFVGQGKMRTAFRRCRGRAGAALNGVAVEVRYPTVRAVRTAMNPWFTLRSCKGIGVFVPPSYLEPWAQRYPWALRTLRSIDRTISKWPCFRALGDHVLLSMKRAEV